MRRHGLVGLVVPGLVLALLAATAAWAGDGTILRPKDARLIKDQYIVQFNAGVNARGLASQLTAVHGGRILHVYEHALKGVAVAMTEQQAQGLALNPNVLLVEQDSLFTIDASGSQSGATWGIDRVDQRNLPLNSTYVWDFSGQGVRVYVIDTGIRTTHTNFSGRASWGTDCTGEGQSDGNGHGTHVAGTVGSETYGVAKDASLIAVKVCTSGGSCPNSAITCGINFVTQQKQNNPSIPMVANMSLGGPFSSSSNSAVNNSVNAGIFYAVAAGNNNSNACNFSPASAANAFTLGSTTTSDARSSFSNFGTCVDIFAPGSSITSTWNTSNSATNTISGTSMASPHAAGAAALVFEEHPTWTPFQVMNELVARATTGVLSSIGSGSPNRLLFTRGGGAPPPPPPPPTGNVFFDDFETNQGWTTNPNGTDTAATGQWERGNPETTTSSGTKQQGTTVSGVNDLVTGRLAGSGVGSFDIDGGTTSIRSPAIALPSSGTLTLSFSYYLAHLNNSSSADFLRVSVVGNTTQQVFQEVGAGNDDDAVWASTSVNVSSFAGQTVRILIEAADAGGASLVEAAVDDVRIQSQ